jgi:GTP-binding protein
VLLHLVDAAGDDPLGAWQIVRSELDAYGAGLTDKREILALTHCDLLDEKQVTKLSKAFAKKTGTPPFAISAPIGEGMEPLLDAIVERLGGGGDAPQSLDDGDERSWSPV